MMRRYYDLEIERERTEDRSDNDFLYQGTDNRQVTDGIVGILHVRDIAFKMLGEAIVCGVSRYEYDWNNKDCLVLSSWEDDDGSDDTIDD